MSAPPAVEADGVNTQLKRQRLSVFQHIVERVAQGANVFQCAAEHSLEDVRAVVQYCARSGSMEVSQSLVNAFSDPSVLRSYWTTECFEHTLCTKQPPEVCAFWARQVLPSSKHSPPNDLCFESLLTGLGWCARLGHTSVASVILEQLLPNTHIANHPKRVTQVLHNYFGHAINHPRSIEHACGAVQDVLTPTQYACGITALVDSARNTLLSPRPQQLSRKQFAALARCLPPSHTSWFQAIVWERVENWAAIKKNVYNVYGRVPVLNYILHYAVCHSTTQNWKTLFERMTTAVENERPIPSVVLDVFQRVTSNPLVLARFGPRLRISLTRFLKNHSEPPVLAHNPSSKEQWAFLRTLHQFLEKTALLMVVNSAAPTPSKPRRKM